MKEKTTQFNVKEQVDNNKQSEQDILSGMPMHIRRGRFSRFQLYEIAFECLRKLEMSERV